VSWPANDALIFRVGRDYTLRLKTGDRVSGRCAMVSPTHALLAGPAGQFYVPTGAVRVVIPAATVAWLDDQQA